ncbi:MAG: cytochrome P450 [Burkholderiales bacterium]
MTATRFRPSPVCPGPVDLIDLSFEDNLLDKLIAYWGEYGDCFVVRSAAARDPIYVLCHPDLARQVLVTNHANYTKGIGIDRVRILLGNGLMASEGDFWHRQRRMIQPGFHRATLAGLTAHITAANEALVARWTQRARERQPVNVTADVSELSLDIVLHALFSEDVADLVGDDHPFSILTGETGRNLQFARKFRALGVQIGALIERRLREDRLPEDLLTLLLHARDRKTGEPMSRRELMDEILTLIVAGHETTASALNWLWYLLAQHPEAGERLHQDSVRCAREAVAIPPADSYTLRALRETLRLYPPGWLITKRAKGDDRIGPYAIPAGAEIFVPVYLLHRHPGFWSAPGHFDPDRFASGREPLNRHAYLPFSAGPRACIGDGFALLEMEIHARTVARTLRLDAIAGPPVELEPQINLRTRQPLSFQPVLR